ncbi:zinc-dependent alcohol dehydrogenase family protein [Donghicola mangrovi]|uniref:Alcohol dehydrogenase catalytic domain-containing protein n=1 Tax=Donghicola mangrovi TaxID=2729614 RepID=A0A850QD33_9RHOB|nr:zinc-dependent alcohol dehydrogenase family protein [Donghicola mangrovi]NVO24335.1 alcohol dehydrogenase catalytic domain-containing protein [Donghicola mangrovi]
MTDTSPAVRQTRTAVLHHAPVAQPYAQTRPLAIENLRLDPPGRDEVLVKIAAAGLCHSDLSVINGDRPRPTPMALGHEASGIVVECGEGVRDLAVGDHVVMVFVPSCGHCAPCAEGRAALCEPGAAANNQGELLGGGVRMHAGDQEVFHHVGVSAFGEYAVVSARSLVKIDKDLPLDKAALFGCAVLTGMGAVVNTAAVRPGQTVAVVGLGGVGLSAVLGALAAGAAEVIAVDVDDSKLAFAKELGATAVVNSRAKGAVDQVKALTGGGVHAAIETAGVGPAFDFAYNITRRGGQTVTASLANPSVNVSIQQVRLVGEERTIRGSYLGGGVPARDIPRYIALYKQGRLPVDRLMTSSGPLEDINAAFDLLAGGKTIRHIITMD